MPELPEVETVVRQLRTKLRGASIESVVVKDAKLKGRIGNSRGYTICEVRRVGKEVCFDCRTAKSKEARLILFHLRMTGRLVWVAKNSQEIIRPGLRLVIKTNKGELRFYDVRRFGTVRIANKNELSGAASLDPMSLAFTQKKFCKAINSTKQNIKAFLLRQDKIVGIGNIYACEILFRAQISPRRSTGSLSKQETKRLFIAIRSVLKKAIKYSGTTFSDFQDSNGHVGGYQRFLCVYQKQGMKCLRCGAEIRSIKQSGRSTYHCPVCQK